MQSQLSTSISHMPFGLAMHAWEHGSQPIVASASLPGLHTIHNPNAYVQIISVLPQDQRSRCLVHPGSGFASFSHAGSGASPIVPWLPGRSDPHLGSRHRIFTSALKLWQSQNRAGSMMRYTDVPPRDRTHPAKVQFHSTRFMPMPGNGLQAWNCLETGRSCCHTQTAHHKNFSQSSSLRPTTQGVKILLHRRRLCSVARRQLHHGCQSRLCWQSPVMQCSDRVACTRSTSASMTRAARPRSGAGALRV